MNTEISENFYKQKVEESDNEHIEMETIVRPHAPLFCLIENLHFDVFKSGQKLQNRGIF